MRPLPEFASFPRKIVVSTITALLLISAVSFAATLRELQDVYEEHLLKIRDDCAVKTAQWSETYEKALQAYRDAAQNAGDLDGLTGANAEMKRFRADGALTRHHLVAKPAGLREVQEKALKDLEAHPLERDRAIIALVEYYVARLESEKTSLTKAGKVTAALDMNAEIKRVESSPAVADAQFNLALQTPAKPPQPTGLPDKRPEDNPVAPPKAISTSRGMIYPNGLRPNPIKNVQLRRETIYATANNPLARPVSVTLLTANTKGGGSSYRAGGRLYFHRMEIKSAKSGEELANVKVVIDYFSKQRKSGYSSSGKLAPKREETHTFTLDRLTGDTTTIDPSYIPSSSSYSSSSSSSYYSSSWYSRDYYGVIISVFSEGGILLYQTGTASGLKDAGRMKP